uniref:ADP ribosylation factor like GTPase 10 n=1 Tax=Anas platyrhynchos platyrhynchos TaxID=8840 RepID=A0A493TPV4_ANAPP
MGGVRGCGWALLEVLGLGWGLRMLQGVGETRGCSIMSPTAPMSPMPPMPPMSPPSPHRLHSPAVGAALPPAAIPRPTLCHLCQQHLSGRVHVPPPLSGVGGLLPPHRSHPKAGIRLGMRPHGCLQLGCPGAMACCVFLVGRSSPRAAGTVLGNMGTAHQAARPAVGLGAARNSPNISHTIASHPPSPNLPISPCPLHLPAIPPSSLFPPSIPPPPPHPPRDPLPTLPAPSTHPTSGLPSFPFKLGGDAGGGRHGRGGGVAHLAGCRAGRLHIWAARRRMAPPRALRDLTLALGAAVVALGSLLFIAWKLYFRDTELGASWDSWWEREVKELRDRAPPGSTVEWKQVLVLGLDGAGKSSVLHYICSQTVRKRIPPTLGFNSAQLQVEGLEMDLLEGKAPPGPIFPRGGCGDTGDTATLLAHMYWH